MALQFASQSSVAMSISAQFCHLSEIRPERSVGSTLERHFWRYITLFLLVFLCWSLIQDLRLKMWYDELYTLHIAQQGPSEIIRGDMAGMDTSPPLYPILVSFLLPVVGRDALAVRLPSTLGFVCLLVCILAFCRRRLPAAYAVLAAMFVATSCLFYATEGRCYGLVLGCAAGAFVCWQRAADGGRRLLTVTSLAILLMLMTALHYYSIFILIPLGVGEITRWRKRRKPDLAVLGAMSSTVAVMAVHLPLVMKGGKYAAHFWSPASWYQAPEFYLKFALLPLSAIIVAALVGGVRAWHKRPPRALSSHEWAAIAALAAAPVVVLAISRYTTHVFVYRYTLWSVIGIAILAACLIRISLAAQPKVAGSLVVVLLGVLVAQEFLAFREATDLREGEALLRQLQLVPISGAPIAVGYSHAFMEMAYYAEPELQARIVCPVDRQLDLQYKGFVDLDFYNLPRLNRRNSLRIVDLKGFLATNRSFILAAHPKDYLPQQLRSSGYRLTALNPDQSPPIFQVDASPQ